ncbi:MULTISPECIES: hypothetical protein [Faecalicatena]|nr:hypothetical protein [Lachnospiraceae bacterium]
MMREKENVVEMNEAIIAGKKSLNAMKSARDALNSAGNWGIADLLGGGFIVDMVKHSKLEEAAEKMEEARCQLELFRCELKDVDLPYNFTIQIDDFLTFADFFFDGLIADWLVQSKIKEAKEEVEYAIERVEAMVANLQTWEKQLLLGKEE